VGAVLEGEALPLSEAFSAYCTGARADPVPLALAGGEDYELVFTVPPAAQDRVAELVSQGLAARRVGRIEAGEGLMLERDGVRGPFVARGFEHFA
jgi:thiamine-monophosphate kinase